MSARYLNVLRACFFFEVFCVFEALDRYHSQRRNLREHQLRLAMGCRVLRKVRGRVFLEMACQGLCYFIPYFWHLLRSLGGRTKA